MADMIRTLSRSVQAVVRHTPWGPWTRRTPVRHFTCPPAALHCHQDFLEVHYRGNRLQLDYLWLRDNCHLASSNNFTTNQRKVDTASIDLNIRPEDTKVEDNHLILTWPGGHISKYSLNWLSENSYEGRKQRITQPRIPWNADIYNKANVAPLKWDTFMSSDDELKTFLQTYLLYGIAFVEDVPATVEATEAVSLRVSLIRETTYGGMWCFTSDNSRGDSAYTNMALDRHTDTCYLHEPSGIQVFHCLKHEGTGGKTLLVDGFYAAENIRKNSPDHFELLSSVPIRYEHRENAPNHFCCLQGIGPILNVYPWNNELYMIRYNNYDRSVTDTSPHDVIRHWYVAHRELTTQLRRPENELWVKLTPGKVIFIDNWRVLHGREAFTGIRQLCGCYLTRDDVLSKARTLGLQA
ncbi:trimethyllysine dioxygenase, mitochondrial isoform X1 [Nerophis ophidion]|uniref:trimethyllysine dioxygenase, mitochondrial isoform X1 n=1 Tax=Nerophis ophidion TaxID=159077 RepID=UPI002ADF2E5F|nr:trimethyllysine dioxygenase, mitochondrial isoform X1 [Nerophis ophidion]XP_061753841.1 trimethyllysine dioxygenase, mitochondrial isoform X1 [Nerophis ophidion]